MAALTSAGGDLENVMTSIGLMMTAEERLAGLAIHLPEGPTPFGAYVPAVQTGRLLFISGMLATSGHAATMTGVVGRTLDIAAGRQAAYTAALNALAVIKKK